MKKILEPIIGLTPMFLGFVLSVPLMWYLLHFGSSLLWLFSIKEISIRFFLYEAVVGVILGTALVIFSFYLSTWKWSFDYISVVDSFRKVMVKVALEYFLMGAGIGTAFTSIIWPIFSYVSLTIQR
jgi:hypothetical protein